MGLTRKILCKIAIERNEEHQGDFRTTIRTQSSGSGDEFVASLRGHRAELRAPFVRGDRYSLVAVMSTKGYIATRVVEGSVDSFEFFDFIAEEVVPKMCPFPDAQSVLVMDNCHIHHNETLQDFLNAAGIMLLYLPPYSPDLNPIEESFSTWKPYLQRNGQWIRNEEDQVLALLDACGCVTAEKARGWFHHAGYIVNH
uniref:Putative transposase n=1 Tax=Moniliophthora roreri TaxID=221103 RepID=A0A0W0GF12_MONRR